MGSTTSAATPREERRARAGLAPPGGGSLGEGGWLGSGGRWGRAVYSSRAQAPAPGLCFLKWPQILTYFGDSCNSSAHYGLLTRVRSGEATMPRSSAHPSVLSHFPHSPLRSYPVLNCAPTCLLSLPHPGLRIIMTSQ